MSASVGHLEVIFKRVATKHELGGQGDRQAGPEAFSLTAESEHRNTPPGGTAWLAVSHVG